TQSPELGFGFCLSLPGTILTLLCFFHLCRCCHCNSTAVVQELVHFAADPQVVQQHRQLSGRGYDGSLLCVSSSSFRQLESPAPEIAVNAERSQDVLCSLHQQRAQVRIAFLADMHLRLALSRVPPSWLQSEIATHVAALREPMRVFQRQQERQRDQCAYSLHLFQQGDLRITFLCQFVDSLVVLGDRWCPNLKSTGHECISLGMWLLIGILIFGKMSQALVRHPESEVCESLWVKCVPELEANSYADDELRLFNCKPLVWRKVAMANRGIQLGGGMIGINRQRSVRNLIVSSVSKCKSCTIKAEASIGDFICDEFNPRVLNTVKGRGATPIIEIENYPRNRRSSRFSKWITV